MNQKSLKNLEVNPGIMIYFSFLISLLSSERSQHAASGKRPANISVGRSRESFQNETTTFQKSVVER